MNVLLQTTQLIEAKSNQTDAIAHLNHGVDLFFSDLRTLAVRIALDNWCNSPLQLEWNVLEGRADTRKYVHSPFELWKHLQYMSLCNLRL